MAAQGNAIREWREQQGRRWFNVDFEPWSDSPFRFSLKPVFPELRAARVAFSPGFTFRDAELVADGEDAFVVFISQSRAIDLALPGRELRLGYGDATLLPTLASAPTASLGQSEYSSRAIKIVVPLSAGSLPDLVTRVVADRVAARLGQPVVIENRPGAAHNIGAEAVARAEPDGYTLLATPGDTLVVNQHLYPRLRFDPGAFVPISLLARVQTVLVVNPNAGFATLPELVAFARENPDTIKYGSPGTGTFPQLATEILRTAADIRLVHVPYRGLPLAISDLIAGRIDMAIDALGHSLPHIQDGKLKALGVASEARNPLLPDVPTISETYPGVLTSGGWLAVVAPPGTSPEIAAKLSQAFAETVTLPEVAKRLRDLSVNPVATSPTETAWFIRQEAERWGRIILSTGVRID